MTDREFLIWIHERLISNGDKDLYDFMHRLREFIAIIPKRQHKTGRVASMTSLYVLDEIAKMREADDD